MSGIAEMPKARPTGSDSIRAGMPPLTSSTSDVRCVGFLLRRVDCNDGVASHCETLMRGLREAGIKVILITGPVSFDEKTRARHDALASLAEIWVKPEVDGAWAFNLKAAREISRAVRDHKIDLLHLHGISSLPLARLAGFRVHVPLVVTAHPSGTSSTGPRGLTRAAIRCLAPLLRRTVLPDRAIAISSELRDWFVSEIHMSPSRVARIFNGVDDAHFRPPNEWERSEARRALGVGDSEFVCSLVGRYEPVKGHDVLCDAARQLNPDSRGMRIFFVGGGDDHLIRTVIAQRNVEEVVEMRGYVDDLRAIYWASDVIALPSRREGFGLVIAEAMLCGTVPLRTPSGGAYDQITHGVDGYIFPFEDAAALAAHLQTLRADRPLCREMGERACRTARARFSARAMVENTIKLYRTAVMEHQS